MTAVFLLLEIFDMSLQSTIYFVQILKLELNLMLDRLSSADTCTR